MNNMLNKIACVNLKLKSLTVYRGLLKDNVISKLVSVYNNLADCNTDCSSFIEYYCDFYYELMGAVPQVSLRHYIIDKILYVENSFSRLSESEEPEGMSQSMISAASSDLEALEMAASIPAAEIKAAALEKFSVGQYNNIIRTDAGYKNNKLHCGEDAADIIMELPEWENEIWNNMQSIYSVFNTANNWKDCIPELSSFHKNNGCGDFARYKSFVWEVAEQGGCLRGIKENDPVRFSDLIGYEAERQIIIDNTLRLLDGSPANNILLYGDRGTGKSTTVKALVNEYGHMGLRIIEIPNKHFEDIQKVIRIIRERKQKFIIFIDDLAFEDNENNYTALKALLEGSLESKPKNAVIYATSNRRNLVKEKFSDRAGLASTNEDDEVRARDTLQEKLSLADRFGIRVTFSSPDKNEYLKIVEGIAKNRGLSFDRETLHSEALKWELWYNGRSPRTARQFVDWLEGNNRKHDAFDK